MYVITFYSFKGGVGRSMALVNVGAKLASAGKRVLLVDFDLEAPSLTSFNLEVGKSCQAGIVEFVGSYLDTDCAPNVRDFISAPQVFDSGGHLWMMPAGACTDDYQARLARINWLDLYERRAGYLLMEEMKAQWDRELQPDYVLIDSRTGHSDVSGICTRQLPDAVAFVFVPNRQNLDGLTQTVRQVRTQNSADTSREIELFFVESNVPYYDDERRTLEKNREMFLERLDVDSFSATLHQHPHLSVLNQSVFVEEFPDTSLAQEYSELATTLRSKNLSDRDAVLPQLKAWAREFRTFGNNAPSAEMLKKISDLHGGDAEICFWLGRISKQVGEEDQAVVQFSQAIELGYRQPEAFLERASLRLQDSNCREGAEHDLRQGLELSTNSPRFGDVLFAVRSLLAMLPENASELAVNAGVQALSAEDQINLAYEVSTTEAAASFAFALLKRLKTLNIVPAELQISWAVNLALAGIQTKRFEETLENLRELPTGPIEEPAILFNRAVAEWGVYGRPPVELFEKVLQQDADHKERIAEDPNYAQCIAIAAYVCGDAARGLASLDRAKRLAAQRPTLHFSAWRYLKVYPREFVKDCEAMRAQMERREDLALQVFGHGTLPLKLQ